MKSKLLFLALFASSVFAQEDGCRDPFVCEACPAGYNASALVQVDCPWNVFADVSFTYWYAKEEGLTLASHAVMSTGALILPTSGVFLQQEFQYEPGFKVGLGANFNDEWVIHSEYTWFRGNTSIEREAPENTSTVPGFGLWMMEDWFQQASDGHSLSGTSVASHWKLGLDIIDLDVGRPYCQGRKLAISPFAGLRALFIDQHVNVALTEDIVSVGGTPALLGPQPIYSHNNSHGWGIGPRIGFMAHWNIPANFKIEWGCSGSLLAMEYTDISHSEDAFSLGVPSGPYQIGLKDQFLMRPNVEMQLGLGWGMYSFCHKYYISAHASYDFAYFWGQNVIRQMLDSYWAQTGGNCGDLFFHGLTFTARVDW